MFNLPQMKCLTPVLLSAVLTIGACANQAPPGTAYAVSPNDPSAAVLVPLAAPARRESYAILTAGDCKKKLFAVWARDTFATPIFHGDSAKGLEAWVKAGVPITLSYSAYNSDKSCVVAATTVFRSGRRYTVSGGRQFSPSMLPTFDGCELRVVDAETHEAVPLLPPLVRPDFTECTGQE
jgi:hypothetical protein